MVANTTPIFARTADIQLLSLINPTAVTATDGTGNLQQIFQSDTTEGSFVDNIILKPEGGNTAATVARIFICSATGAFTPGTTNTANNTNLLTELSIPSTTASNTAATGEWSISIRRPLPTGWRLLIGFGTAPGVGAGFAITTFGGKY